MGSVGLAVGVVGLFGLFNTCIDVVKKYDSWKDFGSESHCLTAQFEVQKLRLQKWGEAVGVEHESVSSKHHELLDDPRTRSNIQNLLLAIKEICGQEYALSSTPLSRAETGSFEGPMFRKHGPSITSRRSKRQRFNWALRGKEKRIAQVAQFSSLVDDLHSLVPIDGDKGEGSKETSGKFGDEGSWTVEFKHLIERIEHDHEVETRRHIQTWLLGDYFPNERYEIYVERRVEGTCQWVLDRPWFLHWSSPDFPSGRAKFLWINGPAGFGKSILCAKITEHLLLTLDTPTAHFFFSSDFERRAPFIVMRSWLSQLMSHTRAFGSVREKWETTQGQRAARGDVLSMLQEIVSAVPGCTFILDGLDECDWVKGSWPGNSDDSITSFLRTLRRATMGTSTRIMIISRDEPEIRRGFSNSGAYDPGFEHRITPEDVQNDILTYSRSIVEEKLSMKINEAKDEITKKLADRCNGQFLWIRLQQDTLRGGKSQRKLEHVINSTPSGIEHIYERNWMKIMRLTEEDRNRAFSLLRWTAFSLRPLTISEISGALVINDDDDELLLDDLPDCIDEDYVNTEIIGLCGSLLDVRSPQGKSDARLKTVHLAHFSVKEYLLRKLPIEGKILQLNAALTSSTEVIENTIIAKKCLRFVDSQEVWLGTSAVQVEEALSAFQKYAAGTWYQHAKLGDMCNTELMSSITTLFDLSNPNWASWKGWFDVNYTKAEEQNTTCGVATAGPLYYAAWFGLTETVAFLILELKPDINDKGYHDQTPLGVASEEGNLEIVRTLLEHGADVAMPNIDGWNPIFNASRNGHTEVVRLLIEFGANVNTSDNSGCTPFHVACGRGHLEPAKLLLKHGAYINTTDTDGWTPIHSAADRGHTGMVELLLEHGADVNITHRDGWTPINSAACYNHTRIVELLLEHGADINTTDTDGWTPIHSAADCGHTRIVELLLEHGADVNITHRDGWTPINSAACNNHTRIVELLLEHRADISIATNNGMTPLYTAVCKNHTRIVELLLEHGADIFTTTNDRITPLCAASGYGHIEVVKLLLKWGADIGYTNKYRDTPLLASSIKGHTAVFKILADIDTGADTVAKDILESTPLHLASLYGHIEIVKLLLERDANIEAKDIDKCTPLLLASLKGHIEVVKLLLEHGADATAKDDMGKTSLFIAASSGHTALIELFLQMTAYRGLVKVVETLLRTSSTHVDALDRWNRTPLFQAAVRGHLDVVNILLLHNANANIKDRYRSTPLFAAVRNGHKDVVERLIALAEYPLHFQDDLDQTLLWWAVTCGDAEIVELICHWAKEHHIEVDESDLRVEGSLVNADETSGDCDVCTRFIPTSKVHYDCKTCFNFWICSECFDLGARCLSPSHEWTIYRLVGST